MKNKYAVTARLKRRDMYLQLLLFPIAVGLCFVTDISIFALYVMAAGQCISCLYWKNYFRKNLLQLKSGRKVRRLFVIVLIIHGVCLIVYPIFFILAIIMLLVGPVMWIAYFTITADEERLYRRLSTTEQQPTGLILPDADMDYN